MGLVNTKKTAIFIKSGGTLPTAPANFLEVTEEIAITPNITVEEFKRINGRLGSNDTYSDVCDTTITQTITHKMRSSNSAGDDLDSIPEYGELLKIGGFDEAVVAGTNVTYTNSQTPLKGSMVALIDGYKHSLTDSVVADLTFNLAIGKAAEISASLSGFVDNDGVATTLTMPSITLNDEPCLIVSCADIFTVGGSTIKPDKVTIAMGAEVNKFYGMTLKEYSIGDYMIKVTADFYPENANYNSAITKLANETVEAIDIRLGTDGTSALIDGKSVNIKCDLAKVNNFSDSTDKSTLKRSITWLIQGDATGKAIEIIHGTF